jgi:hypothetical protein
LYIILRPVVTEEEEWLYPVVITPDGNCFWKNFFVI